MQRPNDLPGAVPEVPVQELGVAAAFYRDRLGFAVDWADEELGLAGISRGRCRLFLASSGYRKGRCTSPPVLIWLNLDSTQAVEDLYAEWSQDASIVVSPVASKPWGLHEFTIADVDGNLFRVFHDFATPQREADG
jgi:hypothetical protein